MFLAIPVRSFKGSKGHVKEEVIREKLFGPEEEGVVVFLCGFER
jgi:hypothetical protein